MYSRLRMGVFGTAGVAAAAKALMLTFNDDWDDVRVAAKNLVTFSSSPKPKPRVVVLGSGWGALSFIRKLDQSEVDLTIVSPRPFFFYTPLLAGTATGTVSSSSIVEPIRWFCDRVGHGGARYIQADCTSIDPHTKRLSCTIPAATHTPLTPSTLALEYDYLVISVGAEPATFNIPGVREHTRFIKEVEDGIAIQRDILQKLELASALQVAGELLPPTTYINAPPPPPLLLSPHPYSFLFPTTPKQPFFNPSPPSRLCSPQLPSCPGGRGEQAAELGGDRGWPHGCGAHGRAHGLCVQ